MSSGYHPTDLQDPFNLLRFARTEAEKAELILAYRSFIRTDPEEFCRRFDIDPSIASILMLRQKVENQSQKPWRMVTISLPYEDWKQYDEWYKDALFRCLRKIYVGQYHVAFELGPNQDHPHFHVLFEKDVKELARSRIITEWSKIFGVAKNYVDVKEHCEKGIVSKIRYLKKEGIWYHNSYDDKEQDEKFEKTKKSFEPQE